MAKLFAAAQHYVLLALRKHNISFPTTKKELLAKAGQELIHIDWDEVVSLEKYCKDIKLENYDTKAAFFNAVIGANTKFNF